MLKVVKGNAVDALENGEINVLAHGVNCSGGFGSGIAGELKKRYYPAYVGYMAVHNKEHDQKTAEGKEGWYLGRIQEIVLKTPRPCVILNCATQQFYGRDGKKYTDEAKVADVLSRAAEFCKNRKKKLGFPFIGAGLGGADKDLVFAEMINIFNSEIYKDLNATLYVLDEKDFNKYKDKAEDLLHVTETFNKIQHTMS